MTAAVYLRKSRADEGDPDALHRHRETLLAFAQKHRMTVAEIFEEIVSGESKRTGVTVNPGEDLVYMKSFRGLPGQWPYQRLAGCLQDSAQENELDI